MHILKKIFLFSIAAFSFTVSFGQHIRFSLATDLDIQRSFKKEQQYWAIGHTVQTSFSFGSKNAIYAWGSYYSIGRFSNNVIAIAKSTATVPQQINYINNAAMRFKQVSIGWKKYLKGGTDEEINWSLYCYAGFGIILGRVTNTHSVVIDTTVYFVPVRSGKANFKRLTLDAGLGWEIPLIGDLYFYAEGRTWIPTTDYPSKYLFINKDAPFVAMLNLGLRVLF